MKHTRRSLLRLSAISIFLFSSFLYVKQIFATTFNTIKSLRTQGVYDYDKKMRLRKSQDNPQLKIVYKEFLDYPNSHKAHKLLHTHYTDRSARYNALKSKGITVKT